MITPVYFLLSLFGCAPQVGEPVRGEDCIDLNDQSGTTVGADLPCKYVLQKDCPRVVEGSGTDIRPFVVKLASGVLNYCASIKPPASDTSYDPYDYMTW